MPVEGEPTNEAAGNKRTVTSQERLLSIVKSLGVVNRTKGWIEPCYDPDWEAKLGHCRYIDLSGKTLCANPQGLLLKNGEIHCPIQERLLTFEVFDKRVYNKT